MPPKKNTEPKPSVKPTERPKLDPKFTYRVGDQEKSIFMSYALLNRLTGVCPDVQQLVAINFFPDVQEKMLAQLLAPIGEVTDDQGETYTRPCPERFRMDEHTQGLELSIIQDMIIWAVGHMTDFLLGLTEKNLEPAVQTNERLKELAKRSELITGPTDSENGSKV
jgi:hypothetical protein